MKVRIIKMIRKKENKNKKDNTKNEEKAF